MYKLIATDLDETLLDSNHQVSAVNRAAIDLARAQGVKIVPASGRGFMAMQRILHDLGLEQLEHEYTISFNGAILTENKENKILLFEGIDYETAKMIFEFGLTKDVCIRLQNTTTIFGFRMTDEERKRFASQGATVHEFTEPNIEFMKDQLISKIVFHNPSVAYMQTFEKELATLTAGKVTMSYSSNRYMEINRLGTDKGTTLLKLAAMLNIKPEEVIAVGDNHNDMAMLQVAGLAVAAGNAVPEVKAACDYVCQNTNDEGVLAELIHKFVL